MSWTKIGLLITLICFITTGCWDRSEPEDLVHALILGFDIDEKGFYEAILQFQNPMGATTDGGEAGGGKGTSSQPRSWTNSAKGQTPFEAVNRLGTTMTRKITLSHVQILLLSERLARHGVGPVFDFIERNSELRLSMRIAAIDGDLKTFMEKDIPMELTPGMALSRAFKILKKEQTIVSVTTLLDGAIQLNRPGEEMDIPRIKALEADGPSGKSPLELSGGAAFRGEKMVGWYNAQEMKGINLLLGKGRQIISVITFPEDGSLVTIDVFRARTSVKPVVTNGEIEIHVKIKADGFLEDLTDPRGSGSKLDLNDPAVIEAINIGCSQSLIDDVNAAINKAKQLESDVTGFGNAVYRKYPKVWAEVSERWVDIFKNLPVYVEAETTIRRPGLKTSRKPSGKEP